MGKLEKKIDRLRERIAQLELEMYTELKQKTSNTAEISIGEYQRKIEMARKELSLLENK